MKDEILALVAGGLAGAHGGGGHGGGGHGGGHHGGGGFRHGGGFRGRGYGPWWWGGWPWGGYYGPDYVVEEPLYVFDDDTELSGQAQPAGANALPFHCAMGKRPPGEQGFDGSIRFFQKGTKLIALATLQTIVGPLTLSAAVDQASIAKGLSMASSNPSISGADIRERLFPPVFVAGGNGAPATAPAPAPLTPISLAMIRQIAMRMASDKLKKKIASPEVNKAVGDVAIERLYIKVVQKDPNAMRIARALRARARRGDPMAVQAWRAFSKAHARSKRPLDKRGAQASRAKVAGWGVGQMAILEPAVVNDLTAMADLIRANR